MNILILEDELNAGRELQRILSLVIEDIVESEIIDSVEDGIKYLSNNIQPDLIFSDIQLADGICFEIYKTVKVKSPIIFCTAFDEYTMEAFETNAISYILKPVTTEKIKQALQKFRDMQAAFEPEQAAKTIDLLSRRLSANYKTALLVSLRDKIIPVQVKDIAVIYLDKTILRITTFANQQYLLSSSLDELERVLSPEIFYRANRQFLVNRNAIDNVERFFSRKFAIMLKVQIPEVIIVSKAKASDFLRWLEGV